jgi:hypothetical protein
VGRLSGVAERRGPGAGNRGGSEFSWPFAAALLGLVIVSIAVMIGLGFALAWFAERVA